jgi:hypothetical protein
VSSREKSAYLNGCECELNGEMHWQRQTKFAVSSPLHLPFTRGDCFWELVNLWMAIAEDH